MKTKDDYIDTLAAELHEWSDQLDLLSAKTQKSVGMAKLKYVQELNALRAKHATANDKMQELKLSSSEAWETVKATADKIWDDLRRGLASAASSFK